MAIAQLLAVVPVSDIEAARKWYTRLFGRPPDNHPMTTLVEWKVVEFGWVQVFCDPSRAGSALLNLAVRDLAVHIAELEGRELSPGPVVAADKGVTLSSIEDPDGNRITFIGNFRDVY